MTTPSTIVFWHRNLPPIDAEIMGQHAVEAMSGHVVGVATHRDDVWKGCYEDLMARTEERLGQEIRRLGGDYAHVVDESIDVGHDEASGDSWLRGRFSYVLYRRPWRRPARASIDSAPTMNS